MPDHSPLTLGVRADLYSQLATMELAGLPFLKALELLGLPGIGKERIVAMRKFVARGVAIHVAGERSGLFTKLEARLIRAATEAGSPASTFRRLADTYTRRESQRKKVRSRMMLPAFMLVAGLFIPPIPQLVAGSISVSGYFLKAFGPLLVLAAIIAIARVLPQVLRNSPIQVQIDRLLPNMFLIGGYIVRRNLRDFFETLALMVEAGVPIIDALPKAAETMHNSSIREPYENLAFIVSEGATFTQALAGMPYLEDGRAIALINTGEASGTLAEMLFRNATAEADAIENFEQQASEWLPRIVYAVMACWIAYGLLAGQGVSPRLPQDLT